jgi:hypothetical protein
MWDLNGVITSRKFGHRMNHWLSIRRVLVFLNVMARRTTCFWMLWPEEQHLCYGHWSLTIALNLKSSLVVLVSWLKVHWHHFSISNSLDILPFYKQNKITHMSLLSKPSEEFSLKNIRIYQNSFCSVMTRQQHLWKHETQQFSLLISGFT